MTRVEPVQPEPERPIKDTFKPVIKMLSWMPSIIILIIILSLTLYVAGLFAGLSASRDVLGAVEGLLSRLAVFAYLSFLPGQLNAFNVACLAMLVILLLCVLSPLWVLRVVVGVYVLGAIIYFLGGILSGILTGIAWFGEMWRGGPMEVIALLPGYGFGLGDLFLAGLLFLLALSGRLVTLVWGWASAQAPAIIALVAAVNGLALLSMWLDKRQSRTPGAYRMPEKALIRYSALGGGPGIFAAALLFRHKTRHLGLLASIGLASAAGLFVLIGGLVA